MTSTQRENIKTICFMLNGERMSLVQIIDKLGTVKISTITENYDMANSNILGSLLC